MSDFWVVSLVSLVMLALLQAVTFFVGRKLGRYNVVDVIWGPGLALVSIVGLVLGTGDLTRRVLVAVLVTIWGTRLGWHIFQRSRGGEEDPRYAEILEGAGTATIIGKVFVTQGIAQWFISLPIQVVAVTGPPHSAWWALVGVGVALSLAGLLIESIADRQLAAFRADRSKRGTIMDSGLWGWSRHPNYFGDACVWTGVYLMSAAVWPGVLTILSPAAMVWFLVVATGARRLERHMQERPGYREYQERTSFFVLRPPRR